MQIDRQTDSKKSKGIEFGFWDEESGRGRDNWWTNLDSFSHKEESVDKQCVCAVRERERCCVIWPVNRCFARRLLVEIMEQLNDMFFCYFLSFYMYDGKICFSIKKSFQPANGVWSTCSLVKIHNRECLCDTVWTKSLWKHFVITLKKRKNFKRFDPVDTSDSILHGGNKQIHTLTQT